MACFKQPDIYESPVFPGAHLCALWLKPLTSAPDNTDHAHRGEIFNDHHFGRTTQQEFGRYVGRDPQTY